MWINLHLQVDDVLLLLNMDQNHLGHQYQSKEFLAAIYFELIDIFAYKNLAELIDY